MLITKEQKIAVLKSVQDDLLSTFKLAKSTETNAIADDRLKIEKVKENLQQLHENVDRLIKWYVNFKKD
jgi:hypothetical protein